MNNYHVNFDLDFKRNKYKGLYIALEGIDGAGKTVQIENLLSHYQGKKREVLLATEPRRTGVIGRVINEILQGRVKIPSASLQYLMTADRISEQQEINLPALERGAIVFSHRCFWSSVPYGILDQSGGRNYDTGNTIIVAQSILSMYYQITVPDVTFYLDVSPKVSLKRLSSMGTKLEYYETLDKLTKVKKGYDWLMKKFPKEFVIVNGDRDPQEISEELIAKIDKLKK